MENFEIGLSCGEGFGSDEWCRGGGGGETLSDLTGRGGSACGSVYSLS